MSDTPTVTLSMFWPLLMQAAGNEYNSNAQTALARLEAKTELPANHLCREAVAEEMAREHFPSGTTSNALGFYAGKDDFWADVRELYDNFEEMLHGQHESGPLSPTDPAHVAMVIRVLAISQGIPVYVECPGLDIKHNQRMPDDDGDPTGEMGFLIRCVRTRPPVGNDHKSPLSAGLYLPYLPGESAENFDVADALFRWMVERHAEIVKATEAEDAAESSKDSEPAASNVLKFKAT